MTDGGVHRQQAGTWSDDTSLTLATLDSLRHCSWRVDIDDMRSRFVAWMRDGAYTVDGLKFDIGRTIATALRTGLGQSGMFDNGNGSLMRILPLAFTSEPSDDDIRAASAITHAHRISMDACVTYVRLARALIHGIPLINALQQHGLKHIPSMRAYKLDTGGFVVGTLSAAIWCLANTVNYHDALPLPYRVKAAMPWRRG